MDTILSTDFNGTTSKKINNDLLISQLTLQHVTDPANMLKTDQFIVCTGVIDVHLACL